MKANKDLTFCRKDKSLGLLCSRFIKQREQSSHKHFLVDESAAKLGGRRRRLYDIINILESIGIVSSLGRNKYVWHGTTMLRGCLSQLYDEIKTKTVRGVGNSLMTYGPTDDKQYKKGILGLRQLTQQFVQMFFTNPQRIVSLEDAGSFLFREHPYQATLKSKKRRLYDIANVLVSAKLLAKVRFKDERQPALLWKGAGVFALNSTEPAENYILCDDIRVAHPLHTEASSMQQNLSTFKTPGSKRSLEAVSNMGFSQNEKRYKTESSSLTTRGYRTNGVEVMNYGVKSAYPGQIPPLESELAKSRGLSSTKYFSTNSSDAFQAQLIYQKVVSKEDTQKLGGNKEAILNIIQKVLQAKRQME
eukprot:jgi/Bigna1/51818/estExt_Genewise1Plus.C_30228